MAEKVEENLKQLNEDQLKGVTPKEEISQTTNYIDRIVVDYMDFMFDGIDRSSVIYPMYNAVVNHTINKIGMGKEETPYKVAVQVASTLLFAILSDIQDSEDEIEESMCNSMYNYEEGEDEE